MTRRPQGSGSVYKQKKSGKWIAQIDLGIGPTGKRLRKSITAATKKEAHGKLRQLEQTHANRQPQPQPESHDPTRMTLATYLDRWFASSEPNWAPRTIENYRHQLDRNIISRIGEVPLAELTPLHVQSMVDELVQAGFIPTANKCKTILGSALKQAVRWNLIDKNPVEAVDNVREPVRDRQLWTQEEARSFMKAHHAHKLFGAFYLLLTSGLRRGELLGLRWQDITEDGLHVRQTLTVVRNRATFGQTKTRMSARFITLAPDTLAVLTQHRLRQLELRQLAGDAWTHPELVFPSDIGTPMHPRNFYRAWRRAIEKAAVPHTRIHDIRHLHISLQILLGEDPITVSERAGHSSTAFTLDRYGHVFDEQRRRTAHSLESLLSPRPAQRPDSRPQPGTDESTPGKPSVPTAPSSGDPW